MDELERAVVRRARVVGAIEAAQQLGPGRVQVVVALELEALGECEPGLEVARLGDRHGPVEVGHRRAGEPGELAVEGRELRPVLRLVQMQGRDRRLQDVRPAPAERQSAVEPGSSRGDLLSVPERPVLIGEEDDAAVGEACLAAGVVHQHQRQQPVHLRLVGHQLGERPPEPDRLGGEVDAAAVALVEDQVHDGEDRGQALGEQ